MRGDASGTLTRRGTHALTDGDWAEVERLSAKPSFRNQQSFLYDLSR